MISADNTTTGRFLDRCRWLWKVPVVKLQQAPTTMPLAEWFARLADTPCDDGDSIRWLLSPPLNPNVLPASLTQIPLADRAVAYLSDHLHVLHLRRNGHWHHLLRSRLSEPALPANTVYFSSHSMPPKLANELVSMGALESQPNIPAASADAAQPKRPTTHPLVTAMPAIGSYLIHCTRRCDGPWPGQSEADYYDSLLLGLPSSHRSALAVLTRIVCQRRLLASAVTNRAGRRAVSFTAVPLPKLPALRKFRPHRARWDFEPYGIGIKRPWLTRRGTKPVIYGEDACWNQLSESEQPFFQKSRSDGKSPVDWTSEKEWRHLGDVDLRSLPHHAAFVFVPDYQAAVQLAPHSPWPVFILNPTHGPQQLQGP